MDNRANVNKHVDEVPLLRVLLLLPAMSSSAKASCTVELFFNYSARLHEYELMQQQQQRLLYLKTQSNTEIQTKEQLPLSPTTLYSLPACH